MTDRARSHLSEQDRTAIRQVDEAYVRGVTMQDWEGVAALLAADGVVMPPNEPAVVGRVANLTRFRTFNVSSIEYQHTPTHIDGDGVVAYLQGTYSLRMNFPGVPDPYVDRGKYLWVLRRDSGNRWNIDRVMWNTDLPHRAG